ncbi:hypothetical protein GCM10007928_25290 [Sulfitobacter porphyrae]|nr:hypothetical protein GCM10007928_25290 [Sulfitobacter porphyrae]
MDEHDALNNVFGRQLALFRKERQVSQLSLSLDADVSTRHISFLETGRSAPRREMIARLSAALGLCHGEHQSLMRAAGYWERPETPGDIATTLNGHSGSDLDAMIAIDSCADAAEAIAVAANALARIGLDQFFTGTMRAGSDGNTAMITHHHVTHAPLGWMLHYRDHNYVTIDPLVRATGMRHLPFFWSDLCGSQALNAPKVGRMFDEGRAFRVANGFVMPIHRADGSVHALSAMAETIEVADPKVRATAKAVSVALLHRLDELGLPAQGSPLCLTRQERDLLLHVLEGRTGREIAGRLQATEESRERTLARACARFGTQEPLEAALRARRAGLLAA